MIKNIFLISLFILCSSRAFCDEVQPATSATEDTKKIFVAVGLGLAFPNDTDSVLGLSLGYKIYEKMILAIEFSTLSSVSPSDYGGHDKIQMYLLAAKYDLSNNWFLKAGGGFRSLETSSHNYSSSPYNSAKANDSVALVGIGKILPGKANRYGGWEINYSKTIQKTVDHDSYSSYPFSDKCLELKVFLGLKF